MPTFSNALESIRSRGLAATVRATVQTMRGAVNQRLGRRFLELPIYSYRMLIDLEDRGISRTLLLFGQRELEHKVMLEKVLRPGMTVLDIGANIGYYALMELAMVGPSGKLIAVEPSPSNVALLRRNLALNNWNGIEIHQAAMSDRPGERAFFLSEMSNLNTFHDTGTGALHLRGDTIDVKTATIPEIMAGRPLDLVRMDVEGHEVEVLLGVLPSIEKGEMAPMIIYETHLSRYNSDHDIEAPLRRLFACGYRVALAGSSSERGTKIVRGYGYNSIQTIPSDGVTRELFADISNEHAIEMITRQGGLRTVLLAPRSAKVSI